MGRTPANEQYDLICIGGGLGGLAAGAAAATLGASVLVLEKSPVLGGVAAYSGGAVWVPTNHLAGRTDYQDSVDEAAHYLDFVGGAGLDHDERLRHAFLTRAPEAVQFFAETCGIAFQLANLADQYYPQARGSSPGARVLEVTFEGKALGDWLTRLRESPYQPPHLSIREIKGAASASHAAEQLGTDEINIRTRRQHLTRGRGLTGGFLAAALQAGAEVLTDAEVVDLTVEKSTGRVTGVSLATDGAEREISAARGVVLATGSYGYAEYAARLEGLPSIAEQAPPIIHGDGLALAEATRAATVRAGYTFVTLGFESLTDRHPGTDVPLHYPVIDSLGRPHCITVNGEANRFGDESFYGTFGSSITQFDSVKKQFQNLPAFAVMDDRYRRNGYAFGRSGKWPQAELRRADTLDDLATQLGLPPESLRATVARFNADAEAGRDSDWGRGSLRAAREHYGDPSYPAPNLGTIDEPPFWGVELKVLGAGIYSHGLAIDNRARVLSRSGVPIEGLYATGNAVAHAELPYGYENGFANARNITYGYLAAWDVTENGKR